MASSDYVDPRLTEQRNPRTVNIDVASSGEIFDLMHAEDLSVAETLGRCREPVARTIDLVVAAFRRGGRLVYVGAGTSGRLGVLDASECPPTFGTDPAMVVGVIAGGLPALTRSQEGAEDRAEDGGAAVAALDVGPDDVVFGIAASGTTPYVRGAVRAAHEQGAATVFFTCSEPPEDLLGICREVIVAPVGPEVLTGSTRMKAGTATKLVLNMVTTGAMIRLGKAYGNLMVDLRAMSEKLVDRGERIVMETAGVARDVARDAVAAADGNVKLAVVSAKLGIDVETARDRLTEADGFVRNVIGPPPAVTAHDPM